LGLEPGRRGSEAYRTGQALSNLPALALPAAAIKGTNKAKDALKALGKKETLKKAAPPGVLVGPDGEPVVIYRGVVFAGDPTEGMMAGAPRSGYATFGSTSPHVASSYANPDLGLGERGAVTPLFVMADQVVEFPVTVDRYGLRKFDKFEFDRRAQGLKEGQVLVARDVVDYGPRARVDLDPQKMYSYGSDVYAFGPKTKTAPAVGKAKDGEVSTEDFIRKQKAPEIKKSGKLTQVEKELLERGGERQAKRLQRAADEIPGLEDQYQSNALIRAFLGRKGYPYQGVMTMKPGDFENFALPLDFPLSQYSKENIENLRNVLAQGGSFDDVPFLMMDRKDNIPFIAGHEGRHRIRALQAEGRPKTLVEVYPRSGLEMGADDMPMKATEWLEKFNEALGEGRLVVPEDIVELYDPATVVDMFKKRFAFPLPEVYAQGGEVSTTDFIRKRQAGSSPEGEMSNDEYIQQMFTGTLPAEDRRNPNVLRDLVRGVTYTPFDLLGGAVDISALLMQPFGYNVEKPVGGSDWFIEQAAKRGLVQPSTGSGAELLGRIAGGIATPGAARGVGRAASKAEEVISREMQAAPAGVIKLPGGNYLAGQVEKALNETKNLFYGTTREEAMDNEMALNKWIDSKLTKYVKNDMATERDPLRLQADKWATEQQPKLLAEKDVQIAKAKADMEKAQRERGVEPEVLTRSRARILELEKEREFIAARTGMHYTPRESLVNVMLREDRESAGFPREPFATSPLARNWEALADRYLTPRASAEEIRGPNYFLRETDAQQVRDRNPWLFNVPPETQVQLLNRAVSQQDTGFKHMTDELRNALNPDSGLPPSLQISVKDLEKMTVPQAANLVDRINAHRAVQKAEADKLAAQKSIEVYKEYPETEQGLRWVEIKPIKSKLPDDFDTWSKQEQENYLALPDTPSRKDLEEALKYEGDIMQHCVGGYCPDVLSGESRIFSLRDSSGRPHTTIEVKPSENPYPISDAEFSRLDPQTKAQYGEYVRQWRRRNPDIEDLTDEHVAMALAEAGVPPAPLQITQIKGINDRKPAAEYIPFVQDFVKGQKWSSVEDLQNTDLIPVGSLTSVTQPAKPFLEDMARIYPRSTTRIEGMGEIPDYELFQTLLRQMPTDYASQSDIKAYLNSIQPKNFSERYRKQTPLQPFAAGGEVTKFIKERSRGSPPEGEMTNDEYIQQMFTGTPPMDRQRNPGILPPELRGAVDVPLDFLNLLVRGTVGAPVGSAYGVYKGVTGGKYGTPEGMQEASSEAGEMMARITGQPKTQTARDVLGFIGEKAEALKLAPMPQLLTLPAPGPGAASALLRNYELAQTPPVGAIKVPGKETRTFSDIPSDKSPFVGRLDKMVAELPGPVQKEQFLNQLKGKFRDYEIGRAREALKDLPDNAKITPFDLLNKIKEDFDPSRYGTSITRPDANKPDQFLASIDNVYKAPLGVIHLRQLANPMVEANLGRARDMYQALKSKTHSGISSDLSAPDVFNNYKANINEFLRDLNQPERAVEANRLLDYAQSSINLFERLTDAVDSINYPTLSSVYKTLQAEQKALSKPFDMRATIRIAIQSGVDELDNLFPGTKVNLNDDIQALLSLDPTLRTQASSNIQSVFVPHENAARESFRQSMTGLRDTLERAYTSPTSPAAQFEYKGQHPSLGGVPNEIAFSRFSEHKTTLPDLGKVEGIYVHELQSDRLDDIRKRGALGGSPTKDVQKASELGKRLQELVEQTAAERQRYLDNPTQEQKERTIEIGKQRDRVQGQMNKFIKRIGEGDYKIKESFVGMEESPQVIQQLMAKNVIAAAIQMGKNFVAFPGAESSQAQLYEKLPNNLKQVVKDLGPGFEYRSITLTTPDGQDIMHPAVVWDRYGAGKISTEGIPFKKGGEVRTEDFIKKVLR